MFPAVLLWHKRASAMLAFCSLATNQLGTVRAAHMRFWGRCRFAAGYHNRLRRLNARQAGNDDQADQAQKRANNEPQQAASPFAPGNGRAGGCNDDPNYCNFHFFYLSVHLIGRILHYTLCGGNSARAHNAIPKHSITIWQIHMLRHLDCVF